MTSIMFQSLATHGQSLWLDDLRRSLWRDGELAVLVQQGLRGLTSNPAIFEKAIAKSDEYTDALSDFPVDTPAMTAYESLAIRDIQGAADLFHPVFEATQQRDGCVSLEVSPHLAHDAPATIAEGKRLWQAINRPNAMIKVPATKAGVEALEALIFEGISVNATLIFSVDQYAAIATAFERGLQRRHAAGQPVNGINSVASFFISRIDSAVDRLIDARVNLGDAASERLLALRGQIAIANAKRAYRLYQQRIQSTSWQTLAAAGAHPQRLLWASTSAKDPSYRDVYYVEELIGADTVNTVPPATLKAFLDHGVVDSKLTVGDSQPLAILAELGIDLNEITDHLLVDGLKLFADAFDGLLQSVERAIQRAR